MRLLHNDNRVITRYNRENYMKKFFIIVFIISCYAPFSFASPLDVFNTQNGTLDIAGGTAHIPVMKEAAKNIMEVNPQIKITITGGGSGVGVQKLGEGLVNIGNTGRPLKETEITKYGLVSFPFAIDGVVIIIHPSNPLIELTKIQLKDIFSGRITNWKEVGGNDKPITLYIREDGSGTREVFEEQAIDKSIVNKQAIVVNSNGAMKTAVGQDRNAIGYVGIGHLDECIKGVVIDNMIPTQLNTANGLYTISRLLYMNTRGEPTGLTKLFIDYIYSIDGKKITTNAGYIPIERN